MTDIVEVAKAIAAEHVRDNLVNDLRVAAQALRASSWPGDMAEEMERRANRLDYAANALEGERCHEWAFDAAASERYCIHCGITDSDPPTAIRFALCPASVPSPPQPENAK